jgi:hypothetical protein
MTNKSDWQEAERRLSADEREKLGEPPTAEEMLAYSKGQLSESEAERIHDFLVAYPELARAYSAPFPEAPREGDEDAVSEEELRTGWTALQRRLGRNRGTPDPRAEAQRGRVVFRHYVPTAVAAALAVVFFALYVQAESRARYYEREGREPRVLAAPQHVESDGNRGPGGAPTMLGKEGEAYLLAAHLVHQVRHPRYRIDLVDASGKTLWSNSSGMPDAQDKFHITIPHDFLTAGQTYRLRIFGVDGETQTEVGTYDVLAPAE